jgi:hypothetical protein
MLRERIETQIGPEYASLLETMRAARRYLRASEPDGNRRAKILAALAASPLGEHLGRRDFVAANGVVKSLLGVDLANLGIRPAPPRQIDSSPQ